MEHSHVNSCSWKKEGKGIESGLGVRGDWWGDKLEIVGLDLCCHLSFL